MSRWLILLCIYMPIVMFNVTLLDGFFSKPVNKSMKGVKNPKMHPYVGRH